MSCSETLRFICIKKTCGLLMSGVWDVCHENPFSHMPINVVQDLLSCMWPKESILSADNIAHSYLLLTSGRLEEVAPIRARDYATLFRTLARGCRNLRTLYVMEKSYSRRPFDAEDALKKLLKNCPKLAHFHSCIYFEPNDLRNCGNIKTLRLHCNEKETVTFSRHVTSDFLKRLRSVEVFGVCRRPSELTADAELRLTRKILANCPRIASLGLFDCSAALKVYDRELRTFGTFRRFQLRRCCWNVDSNILTKSVYCDRIRVAALTCPMIEVLVINVRREGCLQHLKVLRYLASLIINFAPCEYHYRQEFYSLLGSIGPQLRILSVRAHGNLEIPISANTIYKNCPNLRKLELDCVVTVHESFQSCANLLNLEQLTVYITDENSIGFLLSNCLHLKRFCLDSCFSFEDYVLQEILQKNPLADLEMVLIRWCCLRKTGLTILLQSAVKLRCFCLGFVAMVEDDVARHVRDLNPSVVYHSENDFYKIREKLQFHRKSNCFCGV